MAGGSASRSADAAGGVVERAAHSIYLQAISRVGVPLLIAGIGYVIAQVVHVDRRAAMLEVKADQFEVRVTRIENSRETDRREASASEQAIRGILTQIQSDMASLRAEASAERANVLRAIGRLESFVDRQAAVRRSGGE